MHSLRHLSAVLLLGAAAPALASGYKPVSDSLLGPILATPKSAAEVTAMCDKRLAAVKSQRSKLEAMPLSTPAPTLLAAYDDLYNLVGSTAFTEPPLIKDTNPDAAIRKAAEECMQRASEAQTAFGM